MTGRCKRRIGFHYIIDVFIYYFMVQIHSHTFIKLTKKQLNQKQRFRLQRFQKNANASYSRLTNRYPNGKDNCNNSTGRRRQNQSIVRPVESRSVTPFVNNIVIYKPYARKPD